MAIHMAGSPVPLDAQGVGNELNEEECKNHLGRDGKWVEPTTEWDAKSSHDRLWS